MYHWKTTKNWGTEKEEAKKGKTLCIQLCHYFGVFQNTLKNTDSQIKH